MTFTVWGVEAGCICSQQGRHPGGSCPDDCVCESCSCTCGLFCSLGHLAKGGGCRCGCPLHHHTY